MLLEQLRSTGQSAGQSADGDDAVEAHTTHEFRLSSIQLQTIGACDWIGLLRVGSNQSSVRRLFNNGPGLLLFNRKGLHLTRDLLRQNFRPASNWNALAMRPAESPYQGILGVLALEPAGLSVEAFINSAHAFQISRIFSSQ